MATHQGTALPQPAPAKRSATNVSLTSLGPAAYSSLYSLKSPAPSQGLGVANPAATIPENLPPATPATAPQPAPVPAPAGNGPPNQALTNLEVEFEVPEAPSHRSRWARFLRFLLIAFAVLAMPALITTIWTLGTRPPFFQRRQRWKPLRFAKRTIWVPVFFFGVLQHWAMVTYYNSFPADRDRELQRRCFWPPFHLAAKVADTEQKRKTVWWGRWLKSPSGAVASGIGGSIVNIVCSACLIAPVVVALYFAGYYTFDGGRTLVKDLKDFAWDEVRNDREVVLKEMGMGLKEVGLGWKDSLLSSKTAVVLTTAPTVSTATKRLLRIIPTPER